MKTAKIISTITVFVAMLLFIILPLVWLPIKDPISFRGQAVTILVAGTYIWAWSMVTGVLVSHIWKHEKE